MERYSTGIRNAVLSQDDLRTLLKNGKLLIYSGYQPSSADSAVTGTLLCEITQNGGTWTAETLATGSIKITTWTANSFTSVTVSGIEVMGATIAYSSYGTKSAAANAMAEAINKYNPLGIKAVSDGIDTVTLRAPYGVGNVTWVVVTTSSGAGAATTDTDFSGGVAPANGLQYELASNGVITQSGTWSGTVINAGTAGWFRIVGSVTDSGGTSTTLPRVDGSITSVGGGGDLVLTSTALAVGAPITLTEVTLTFEATGR